MKVVLPLDDEEEENDEEVSLPNVEFSQQIEQKYGKQVLDQVNTMISNAQNSSLQMSIDRYSSSSTINGEKFEYSRYDRGKFDSGADCMFINIRHEMKSGGWCSVLSFADDYVGGELKVSVGKNVRIIKEKMGFKEMADKIFVACLIKSMSLGPNDKNRLMKALKDAKVEE